MGVIPRAINLLLVLKALMRSLIAFLILASTEVLSSSPAFAQGSPAWAFWSTFAHEGGQSLTHMNPGYWIAEYWGGHGAEAQDAAEARLVEYYLGIMHGQSDATFGASLRPELAFILGALAEPAHIVAYGKEFSGKEVGFAERLVAAGGSVLSFTPASPCAGTLRRATSFSNKATLRYPQRTLLMARDLLNPERTTQITLEEVRAILKDPSMIALSSSTTKLKALFPGAPDDMIESMHRAFHGKSIPVPPSLSSRISGELTPFITHQDLLNVLNLADDLKQPVVLFGSKINRISPAKGRFANSHSDLDAGLIMSDKVLDMLDDLPDRFQKHGLSFDGFPDPEDVGGIVIHPSVPPLIP
jgi:hypothetical protein